MMLPALPFGYALAAYGAAAMLGVYAGVSFLFSSKTPRSPKSLKFKSLPLTVTAVAEPEYRSQGALLFIPPVILINTSVDRAVAIRIFLAITDEFGVVHRVEAEGNAQRIGPLPNEAPEVSPLPWILSPATIEPVSAIEGPIAFVPASSRTTSGMEPLQPLGKSFKYALEILDARSGMAITIHLPSDGFVAG